MRTFLKLAAALGLAACISTPALAQGRGGFGMMGGGGNTLQLLSNKSVQKELKLTDEQIEKATKASTEAREKNRERFQELQNVDQAERQEKMTAMMREMATESKKVSDEILKPEQAKRLDQITLQVQGYRAFSNPETQSKLKLTDEQKNKIKDMGQEAQDQMREIFQAGGQGGDRAEMQKKMTAFTKELNDKAAALLTSEQKATWKELTGEPFTYVQEQVRRPGGNNN
jgi:Spy/CpxP family protein refolding chaperone